MVVTSDRNCTGLNNKDFYHLLDKTKIAIKQKSGPIRVLSFSFALPALDPLGAIQLLEAHQLLAHHSHFYWEWNQEGAIAAVGHTAQVEFQGSQRFQQGRYFAEQCFHQTVGVGDVDLPLGGPHLFCSFTFFDDRPVHGPFAPATLFLPRWHLARHHQQTVLVLNYLWSLDSAQHPSQDPGSNGVGTPALESLCRSVWQTVAPLQEPGASLLPLLALLDSPAHYQALTTWPSSRLRSAQTHASPLPPLADPDRPPGGPPAPEPWVQPLASVLGRVPSPLYPLGDRQQLLRGQRHFKRAVEESLGAIAAGKLGKVVLAHTLEVGSGQAFQVGTSLANLRRLHPDCYRFAVGNGQGQTFLGASPERLLRIDGGQLYTEALAGSAPRGGTPLEDEGLGRSLLASPKERHEHQLVAEFIVQQLQHLGLDPQCPPAPSLRQLATIQHLLTPIAATLPPQIHPLTLVAQLHPTPAVAGVPRATASAHIRHWESFDRSLYAAPLGWMDDRGNCEFIVGIRSALLDGDRARLFAGAGIVSGSDPDRELIEVELKFQTLLSALV